MQTSKSRSSLETAKKVSLKAARQVKPTALKCDSSSSSNQTGRISKERSPKIIGRSPRTPLSEKKCQNKISELESQISILQKDLKKAKEQLHSSKLRKDRARVDAEVSSVPSNAKEHRLSSSEQGHPKELQKQAQEDDQSLHSASEVTDKSESVDSVALAMVNVMQQLKLKLRVVDESKAFQTKHAGSVNEKHSKLKKFLSEILSLMGSMKNQLQDCEVSESQVQALISETTAQLETAKEMVELLGSDSTKAFEDWNSVTLELDESREHVSILETLVCKLEPALANASWKAFETFAVGKNREQETQEGETRESEQLEADLSSPQSAPLAVEGEYEGKQGQSTLEPKPSTEAKHVKSDANPREIELKKELEKSRLEIDEFRVKLLNRETELRSITEENLELSCKLEKSLSSHRVYELEKELDDLKNCIADLKANLLDKETEFQSVSEENEMLISEISKRDTIKTKVKEDTTTELVTSTTIDRDTQVKLGIIAEETDRSTSRKSVGIAELEAAQAANAEMEMELRTLKVQSEQWRKAAEAAAAMISAGSNGEFVGRTGSMDSNYNAITGKIGPLYSEDSDDDLLKKKNVNVLRKIGVLWKKPQK
ncbi:hypothetical protein IC582_026709 [Cucumis melo]|uniref:Interactor of constitutive active ROPs 3 isoform X1 n=1 Tax=Cucumis melo TaxID=3656 RepID=A0A1S3CK98_CUCME|nr:interactor of constitutive active ROPs 3 isoform X1 [Cucumis melo]XP_008463903.2 interactor of constitutive active ROPs 3 isoform X1 [Cucumis melo]